MTETRLGQATNFDSWKHSYAKRAENLAVSEVRALFSVVSRPEVVSLAGGMPDVSAMDNGAIRSAFDSLMSSRPQYALQYGGGQGDLRLRANLPNHGARRSPRQRRGPNDHDRVPTRSRADF